jgi:tetratricopeptide (TPR) repeat protein
MNWKERLNEYEKNKEWIEAIRLLEQVIEKEDCKSEPVVRMIYLLHNLLVEEDYKSSGLEHDFLASLLLKYFQESLQKFGEDAEYLFFIGIILHIAEWYFGQDDVHLALQMQRKAVELDPQNILYAFSYNVSVSNKTTISNLVSKLLNDKIKLQWLESKGFPGQYVLGIIKAVDEGKV